MHFTKYFITIFVSQIFSLNNFSPNICLHIKILQRVFHQICIFSPNIFHIFFTNYLFHQIISHQICSPNICLHNQILPQVFHHIFFSSIIFTENIFSSTIFHQQFFPPMKSCKPVFHQIIFCCQF